MLGAWPHRWEEMRAGLGVAAACHDPAWSDDTEEVEGEEEPAALA